nr:MAG TPA: hypothetical protein [Microviridae sp.]
MREVTPPKKWRFFFRKTLDKTFFLCYTMAAKKKNEVILWKV